MKKKAAKKSYRVVSKHAKKLSEAQATIELQNQYGAALEQSVTALKQKLALAEINVTTLIARVAQEQERYGQLEQRFGREQARNADLLNQLSEIERNRPHRRLKRFLRLDK